MGETFQPGEDDDASGISWREGNRSASPSKIFAEQLA